MFLELQRKLVREMGQELSTLLLLVMEHVRSIGDKEIDNVSHRW
jgi:hypothetical protein